jgi:hypothetical protein
MNDKILDFQRRMNDALREGQRLCFMTRAIELQTRTGDDLQELRQEASALKAESVAAGDGDAANVLLAFENVIGTLIAELRMWVELKNDNPFGAWNRLIDAQSAATHSVRAHPVAEHMTKFAERLELLEKVLFPPQVFNSPGMLIKSAECSICQKEYGTCEHLKGRPYMGEICRRIPRGITFTEASIVEDPADKRCIVTSFSSDGLKWINRMTLRQMETSGDDEPAEGGE